MTAMALDPLVITRPLTAADLVAHGVHVRPDGSWTYRPLPSAA